jgi:Phasin protein
MGYAHPARSRVSMSLSAHSRPSLRQHRRRRPGCTPRRFHGITTLSGEVRQFIQRRLQDEMAGWSAVASCKTPEVAFECRRRFAEKATARYAEEITKLSQMMLRLATEGLDSFQRRADTNSPTRAEEQ